MEALHIRWGGGADISPVHEVPYADAAKKHNHCGSRKQNISHTDPLLFKSLKSQVEGPKQKEKDDWITRINRVMTNTPLWAIQRIAPTWVYAIRPDHQAQQYSDPTQADATEHVSPGRSHGAVTTTEKYLRNNASLHQYPYVL